MKVIDLLNKLAKGEKVPEKFKYEDMTYIYRYDLREHFDEEGNNSLSYTFDLTDYDVLNDEIEILDDRLEEIMKEDLINHLVNDCGFVIEDTPKEDISNLKWGEYVIKEDVKKCSQEDLRTYISLLMETQNKIIDYLKNKGE